MAAQDVRDLIPRVRRAIEGPVPPASPLTDEQVLALAADAIADIILLTAGGWEHTLVVTSTDGTTGYPDEWEVDPALTIEEESVIAAQAAMTYLFHEFKSAKVSERISHEGTEWEYSLSANLLRDQFKLLKDIRDQALAVLIGRNPVFAKVASILAVRDSVTAAFLEPYLVGAGVGGYELTP